MESVNVLVTHPAIDEKCQQQIANVNPRIKVRDASDLLSAERRGDFSSKEFHAQKDGTMFYKSYI